MLDGITYITTDDQPELMFTADGGVMLGVTVSSAIRWRTRESFNVWLEKIDRQNSECPHLDSLRRGEPVLPLAEAG